ncbi:MAG: ABC transporter permease [Ardenticatenaceae bacterium]|nr:ABC transporter permease [Ardenticatenaceae bacterium]HBY99367.1 peptide ABC transporter [Chloroflexota bacterium]
MVRYILRRLVLFIPVALGITIIVFVLIRFAPGDPIYTMLGLDYSKEAAEGLRHQLGLDRPIPVQYAFWVGRVLRGELGRSFFSREPVLAMILRRLPTTVMLTITSMSVALLISVPTGIISARWKDTIIDNVSRLVAILGVSIPVFWLGLMLLVVFGAYLRWFPIGGTVQEYGPKALVLPSIALGSGFTALLTRMIRSNLIETLGEDYIRTARAKGLTDNKVYFHHALKNALIPVITVVGLQFGTLLGGAVLTETIFNLPGLGRLLVDAINARDYPIIQGCVLTISFFFVVANLVVDVMYGFIDPRIRYR